MPTDQDVCPYNVKFAQALKVAEFAPREFLASKDARTLARDLLAISQDEFAVAFKGSPMKRAKLRGLRRNACVVLGNVGSADDADALASALADPEPLVREHAAWALEQIRSSPASSRDSRARVRVFELSREGKRAARETCPSGSSQMVR